MSENIKEIKSFEPLIKNCIFFLDFKDIKKGRTFVLLTSIISIQQDGEGAVITLDSGLEISVQLTVTAVMSSISYAIRECRKLYPKTTDAVPVMVIHSISEDDKASLDRPMGDWY